MPIAERELRVGARSKGTYSSRRNIATFAILIFAALYLNFGAMGAWVPAKIFALLSLFCFIYTLLAGLILAADTISSEKRDGTLGLLFLTTLKPRDLVAGMISATSLKSFCGLLAAFPILGLTFLLGGVGFDEFARVCLTLISALIFSLSLSLLTSCFSHSRLLATSRAAFGLIFFTVLIPGLCRVIKNATPGTQPRSIDILNLFSPSTTLELSSGRWVAALSDYWWSLFIVNAMSVILLVATCMLLPWVWKDGRSARWDLRATWIFGQMKRRSGLGTRNPFYWLASRQSWESTKFLVGLLLLGLAASVAGRYTLVGGKSPVFATQLAVWSFVLAAAHAVLLFKFAALSTSRLAEDRELGALESILVTPLRVKSMIRGQWHALVTQLGGPAVAVLFLHGLIFWALLTQFSLDQEIAGGASALLRIVFAELKHGSVEPWEICIVGAVVLGSATVLFLNWVALCSMGMWIALRARRPAWAVWLTLGTVLMPPVAAFSSVVSLGVWMGLARGNGPYWAWYCIFFGFTFGVLNALCLIAYAAFRLRKDFRQAATDQFVKPLERDWVRTARWGLRIAAATVTILILIAGFYGEEKWRGLRAWRQLEREYGQRGEKLNPRLPPAPPAVVPDAQNFGSARIFQPLFDYHYDASGKVIWANQAARRDLMTITVTGREKVDVWTKSTPDPNGNWALQKMTDLAAWQKYYRSNEIFSSLCSTGAPASAVLQALSLFSPELNDLEEASRRPCSNFPVHYNETHAAYIMQMPFLKNVADILDLRATARLADGDIAGARSDILFCVRLANAMNGTRGIYPFRMRMIILTGALHPLWEGLARHQWDEQSLATFQKEVWADLLAAYPKAVREQTESMADFFERITLPDEVLLTRLGSFPITPRAARFYPDGWRYLNQTGLFRLADASILPMVDAPSHRVFPRKADNLNLAIRRSHVSMDPISQIVIPWEVESFSQIILITAHTQVSLDQAMIACALERRRLVHKDLPESLDSLAPAFIQSIPLDPITAAPFHYKKISNDRFILYSPGWDEKDDGGKAISVTSKTLEQDFQKGDWVWKYPDQ